MVILSTRDSQKLSKDLKDQFIGTNLKQKVRLEIDKTNTDTFSNQILLESIDYLF